MKLGRTPAELEDTLDYADFVVLLALDSINDKPASPFGKDGAENALFDLLQGR